MLYSVVLILFSLFTSYTCWAQCNPREYTRIFNEAITLQEKGEFIEAKNRYEAAKIYACNEKEKDATDERIDKLFDQMDKLREYALAAQNRADSALRKATQLINAIYFYQNKFGLAYNSELRKYGFMDQQLNVLIDFKYPKAQAFDNSGFAKVQSYTSIDEAVTFDPETYKTSVFQIYNSTGDYYMLIDTNGNEYPMAIDLLQIRDNTTALDFQSRWISDIPELPGTQQKQIAILLLSNNYISKFPRKIIGYENLTVLNLSYNQLSELPIQIGQLHKLTSLNLRFNKLNALPEEIGQLKNLKVLNLQDNPISETEQDKIKQRLPLCEITF